MATTAGVAAPLAEADLLELAGEDALEEVKELTLRNHKLQSLEQFAPSVPNLAILSLSHNLITSLAGIATLQHLSSLNLNFNGLASLDGIQACSSLQHLFANNNRVRDLGPLAGMQHLQTLHLFRNNVAALEHSVATLATLPSLRELELGGNPCANTDGYKHRMVYQLELETLDGDTVNQLDYDLAAEWFQQQGLVVPDAGGEGTAAQVLTLDADDEAGASEAAVAAGPGPGSTGAAGSNAPTSTVPAGSSKALRSSGSGSGSILAGVLPSSQRPDSGATAGTSGMPPLQRPGTSGGRPGTAGGARPGTAGGFRPSTAPGGSPSAVQLYSNELLNDHPVVLEYLAKHVLQEGMELTQQAAGGGKAKGSFAQRLRDTAAVMNACEGLNAKELAARGEHLVPSSSSSSASRAAAMEQMISASTPHETIRQLVRLCEVLIQEVEKQRSSRPGSSNGRPGTAMARPPSAGAPPSASAGPSAAAGAAPSLPSGFDEASQLRSEVDALQRQVKQLQLENQNIYWLSDEVKRLRAELKAAKGE